MGLNDAAEKRRQAKVWLDDKVPFTEHWNAAFEHLGVRLTDQERAVLSVAAQNGMPMSPDVAKDMVRAAAEAYSDIKQRCEVVRPDFWDNNPDYREHIRASMRRKFYAELVEGNWLPTRAFNETVTRQEEPWSMVTVELTTTVRRAE